MHVREREAEKERERKERERCEPNPKVGGYPKQQVLGGRRAKKRSAVHSITVSVSSFQGAVWGCENALESDWHGAVPGLICLGASTRTDPAFGRSSLLSHAREISLLSLSLSLSLSHLPQLYLLHCSPFRF